MSAAPAPELTRLSDESSLTNPFDWLLLLGFPAEVAKKCLDVEAAPVLPSVKLSANATPA
jgi:hypothetical protein